jgi:hypothetical protein
VSPHFSDSMHLDPCRRCGALLLRSEMVEARKVTALHAKRGWCCLVCAVLYGYRVPDPKVRPPDEKPELELDFGSDGARMGSRRQKGRP